MGMVFAPQPASHALAVAFSLIDNVINYAIFISKNYWRVVWGFSSAFLKFDFIVNYNVAALF